MMIGIFIFMLITALNPKIPMIGAREAVELCLFGVIPSLFPFFVLNNILMKSGIITRVCNRFLKPFPKIFNLPPSSASAVILGFLSGYPSGVKVAEELYENGQLSKEQYQRLISFCGNAGPAFITGTVGIGMFGSSRIGIILFAVHLLSAFIVGFIFRFYKTDNVACHITNPKTFHKKPLSALFTDSVSDSVKTISSVCGYVIFFGMVTALFQKLTGFMPPLINGLLNGFIEMTNGCRYISNASAPDCLRIAAASAIIGWGGLCVHAQSLEFLKFKKTYIIGKATQGIISFTITYLVFDGKLPHLSIEQVTVLAVILSIFIIFISIARRQFRHF